MIERDWFILREGHIWEQGKLLYCFVHQEMVIEIYVSLSPINAYIVLILQIN